MVVVVRVVCWRRCFIDSEMLNYILFINVIINSYIASLYSLVIFVTKRECFKKVFQNQIATLEIIIIRLDLKIF